MQNHAYYKSLENISVSIKWLLFTVCGISLTTVFLIYVWYWGDAKTSKRAYKKEKKTLECILAKVKAADKAYFKLDSVRRAAVTNISGNRGLNTDSVLKTIAQDSILYQNGISVSNLTAKEQTLLNYLEDGVANQSLFDSVRLEKLNSIQEELTSHIASLDNAENRTNVNSISFIGIQIYNSDFVKIYILIGSFLILWLMLNIRNAYGILKDLVNSLPLASIDNSLSSYFYFIYPNHSRYSFYKISETAVGTFSFFAILLFATDIYDIFLREKNIIDAPSFGDRMWSIILSSIMNLFSIGASIFAFFIIRQTNIDIRNILFIIIYSDKIADTLADKANFVRKKDHGLLEYRKYSSINNDDMVVHLIEDVQLGNNPKTAFYCVRINFLYEYYRYRKTYSAVLELHSTQLNEKGGIAPIDDILIRNFLKHILIEEKGRKAVILQKSISTLQLNE